MSRNWAWGLYVAFESIFVAGTYCAVEWEINVTVYLFLMDVCSAVDLYGDYSRHVVGHICAMWKAYLFRGICQ